MYLLTLAQVDQMLKNGSPENRGNDHIPVVKLFLPGTACTWILTELDPEEPSFAFGLCDLGMGFPELGTVDLNELMEIRAGNVFRVERDLYFKPKFPISVYSRAALANDCIIEDDNELAKHVSKKPPKLEA